MHEEWLNIAKITEKQKRFADFYIKTGNATQSYKDAGYAGRTANTCQVNACRVLSNANVRAYIDERLAKKDRKRIMSQDEVLEMYTKIARGEEKDVNVNGLGVEKKVSPTLKERIKALDALAKRYGLDRPKTYREDNKEAIEKLIKAIKDDDKK